jgi:hypothetical protein
MIAMAVIAAFVVGLLAVRRISRRLLVPYPRRWCPFCGTTSADSPPAPLFRRPGRITMAACAACRRKILGESGSAVPPPLWPTPESGSERSSSEGEPPN